MNLTGARTSHQMGKEIGYERWPAIKSDIPQCHLSDSGWGIMTTANESWALVRRWFKSAPCCGRLTVLTQCSVLYPAQLDATEQKSGETLTIIPNCLKHGQKRDWGSLWCCSGPGRGLYSPQTAREVRLQDQLQDWWKWRTLQQGRGSLS